MEISTNGEILATDLAVLQNVFIANYNDVSTDLCVPFRRQVGTLLFDTPNEGRHLQVNTSSSTNVTTNVTSGIS